MHPHGLQRMLGLLALFVALQGSISPVHAECTTQAWVRAPDLIPNTIVQGDARVKISAECPAVERVLLGLRFKERSFLKTLRSPEDRKRMKGQHPPRFDLREASPWAYPPSRFDDRSDEVVYYEMLADKDAWLVREQERVVFETTQPITIPVGNDEEYLDVVQDFAVLVPSTNFPPAQDYMNSGFMLGGRGNAEIVDLESVNEYFVRISFANGTMKDVSAGFTGFEPLYDPRDASRAPSSETVELKSLRFPSSPVANYTAQISHESGLVFVEGSEDQFITVVVTRTGPARAFSAPLTIWACLRPTFSSKWAAEYDMSVSEPWHNPEYVLRSTLEDVEEAKRNSRTPPCFDNRRSRVTATMPSSTADEIGSHEIVTTTSAPFIVPVKLYRRQLPNFDAYYQTLASSLTIRLEIPRTKGESVDPDDPSSEAPAPWPPEFEDDELEWVPWEKPETPKTPQSPMPWPPLAGTIPAIVRPLSTFSPSKGCLRGSKDMDMTGQQVLSGEKDCEQLSLTHYLDEGARGPVFVETSDVPALLIEDPAVRELRAPILQPVVSSSPEGEEFIYRYYRNLDPRKRSIYVGETWARRVGRQGEI